MTTHELTAEYLGRLDRFAVTFPAAHEFLKRLEREGTGVGFWLSTAVNAHLSLQAHSARTAGWAKRHAGGFIEFGTATPPSFFAMLYERLVVL